MKAACRKCGSSRWRPDIQKPFRTIPDGGRDSPSRENSGKKSDTELKKKRQLSILKIQLKEAAAQERYEEAAQLRDHIARMEKEVCAHEG